MFTIQIVITVWLVIVLIGTIWFDVKVQTNGFGTVLVLIGNFVEVAMIILILLNTWHLFGL